MLHPTAHLDKRMLPVQSDRLIEQSAAASAAAGVGAPAAVAVSRAGLEGGIAAALGGAAGVPTGVTSSKHKHAPDVASTATGTTHCELRQWAR